MKVFILTEGGENTGLGHITRCTSIYPMIKMAEKLDKNGNSTLKLLENEVTKRGLY